MLNREYALAAELLDLDEAGLAELARAAVRASFADDTVKSRVLAEIHAYATGSGSQASGDGAGGSRPGPTT